MNILIVVTHLLGTGHLSRALVLSRAFAQAGEHVTLVSGGMPAPHLNTEGVTFVQLEPVRSDGVDFTRLLDANDALATADHMERRKRQLCTALNACAPDAIITELYPFGRRILAEEFTALLDVAAALHPHPLICASVRDILAPPSKPAKALKTQDMIMRYFQAILVHSDPEVTPLEKSWPVTPEIAAKLRYTGFVAPPPAGVSPDSHGAGHILVSTGGGNVAETVYTTALDAATLAPELSWHLLVAGDNASARIKNLQQIAPDNVTVTLATPAFRQMLYHADALVSLCGYNTALDVLQSGAPAVFVPFDDGGEVEQTLRAQALAALDGIEVIKSANLSPENLLNALQTIMATVKRTPRSKGLDGAPSTVKIVRELWEQAQHGH
ncbi:MAG: glycosyltransferase [Roseobacter sp.]